MEEMALGGGSGAAESKTWLPLHAALPWPCGGWTLGPSLSIQRPVPLPTRPGEQAGCLPSPGKPDTLSVYSSTPPPPPLDHMLHQAREGLPARSWHRLAHSGCRLTMQGGGASSECPAQLSRPSWQLSLSYCPRCCPILCASSSPDTVRGEWAKLLRPHTQLGWEDEVGPGVSRALPHHLSRAPRQGQGRDGARRLGGLWGDGSLQGAGSRSPASLRSLGPGAHPQLPTLPPAGALSPRGAGPGFCPPHSLGGPPRTQAHSLPQVVLGPTVLVGVREDASVSREGGEGVTSTEPAVLATVPAARPPLGWSLEGRAAFCTELCSVPRKVPTHRTGFTNTFVG